MTASVESEAGAAPHPPPLRGGTLSREREREANPQVVCPRRAREALKRLVKKQQAKIYALENAGMLEAQRTTLAALKDEFNRQR